MLERRLLLIVFYIALHMELLLVQKDFLYLHTMIFGLQMICLSYLWLLVGILVADLKLIVRIVVDTLTFLQLFLRHFACRCLKRHFLLQFLLTFLSYLFTIRWY